MQARKNFIINYSGREGSSAIVSMLSAQKGIHVPLFEDLDAHALKARSETGDPLALMRQTFAEGALRGIERHGALANKPRETGDVTGFKMRLRAPAEDIAPILLSQDISYFILSRRDFVEHLCSLWLNTRQFSQMDGIDAAFPQFKLMQMNEEEREAARNQMDQTAVAPRVRDLLRMGASLVRTRRRMSELAVALNRLGVPVYPLYYEDFLADRVGFVRAMMKNLGFPADWPVEDSTRVTKVLKRPAKSRFGGARWMIARMLLELNRQEYHLAQLAVDRQLHVTSNRKREGESAPPGAART